MSAPVDNSSLAERARQVREASAFMETGRSTWAGASVAASNSSCDTRCDTPDEKTASEATLDGAGGLRAAIRNALRPLAARPPEADAGPGEPEPDGGGPGPRIQEPVDIEETAQATRTISVRLTDDDFQLIQERCRAHGVSRSDYIRQLARVDAVTGDVGARLVLDRTTMLAVAKEMRAWGRHYNQAVHALNVMAKYLRNAWNVDGNEVADQLVHVRSRLDDMERGQEDIAARIDELCCLDAIRGR